MIEQEDIGHDKGRPFVPIEKSPVTGNAISIGGGEIRNVWSSIGHEILRSMKGELK